MPRAARWTSTAGGVVVVGCNFISLMPAGAAMGLQFAWFPTLWCGASPSFYCTLGPSFSSDFACLQFAYDLGAVPWMCQRPLSVWLATLSLVRSEEHTSELQSQN